MQRKQQLPILSIIFTALVVFLLASCSNFQSVKIGVSLELSGATSDLGAALRNGAQLAVEEINASGGINGREIDLIIKDDKGSTEVARQNDQDLINAGVVAILGHATSERTSSALDIINENDVLMISGSATGTEFTGIDDNFLRVTVDTRKFALATSAHISNTQNNKDILIVYSEGNSAFVDPFISHFQEDFEARDGNILGVMPVCCSLSEIQQIAVELSEINPPSIMAITTAYDLAHLAQYSEQIGFTPSWYSTLWAGTSELLNKGGAAVDGVELAMSFNPEDQSVDYLRFKTKYFDRFGSEPSLMAVSGYTIIQMLTSALEETDGNFKGLKEELIHSGSIQSIQGEIEMDAYGDVNREIHITRVIDGAYVVIDSVILED